MLKHIYLYYGNSDIMIQTLYDKETVRVDSVQIYVTN